MPDVIGPEFESRGQELHESVQAEQTPSNLDEDESETEREEAGLSAGACRAFWHRAADEREAGDGCAPCDDGGEKDGEGPDDPPHGHGRATLRHPQRNPPEQQDRDTLKATCLEEGLPARIRI